MASQEATKVEKAVELASSNKRRVADGENMPLQRKRQRTGATALIVAKSKAVLDQVVERPESETLNHVFRFMELPGELRNRIYEYAEMYSFRCFPVLRPKHKSKAKLDRSALSRSAPLSAKRGVPKARKVPYIGLVQACSQIRSEFRPAWLRTHCITLSVLESYLKDFLPISTQSLSAQQCPKLLKGSPKHLRVLVSVFDPVDMDVKPMLKHILRLPALTITFQSLIKSNPLASVLNSLFENRSAIWVKHVRGNSITQVRLLYQMPGRRDMIRIVVKERYAPKWMYRMVLADLPDGEEQRLRSKLGLKFAEDWQLQFGIDYS